MDKGVLNLKEPGNIDLFAITERFVSGKRTPFLEKTMTALDMINNTKGLNLFERLSELDSVMQTVVSDDFDILLREQGFTFVDVNSKESIEIINEMYTDGAHELLGLVNYYIATRSSVNYDDGYVMILLSNRSGMLIECTDSGSIREVNMHF